MRRLLAAILVAVLAWLGFVISVSAQPGPTVSPVGSSYAAHQGTSPRAYAMTERGPPATSNRVKAHGAGDRLSHGAPTRSGLGPTSAAYTYDEPPRLVQAALATYTPREHAPTSGGELWPADRAGVAANAGRETTILGENMGQRVMPFAEGTGARHLGFGATADEWAAMTPRQRWKLNDGMLRARINEGDSFRYIGRDADRPASVRAGFDLTGSELLRLNSRGIPYDIVSPAEVFKILGRY
jgi:hypothetical protein